MAARCAQRKNAFEYTNSLERAYDARNDVFTGVIFHISRFGKHRAAITADPPVTEAGGIALAEAYLSQTLTKDFYDIVKDDVGCGTIPWSRRPSDFTIRGDCVGDSLFVEEIEADGEGNMRIVCGS